MNAGLRRLAVALIAVVGTSAFALVPGAGASTEDVIADSKPPYTAESGWQAGTCTEEPPEKPEYCSIDTPD